MSAHGSTALGRKKICPGSMNRMGRRNKVLGRRRDKEGNRKVMMQTAQLGCGGEKSNKVPLATGKWGRET